jgi:RNA polymerase sigma-70 factor (ECF subfamily)
VGSASDTPARDHPTPAPIEANAAAPSPTREASVSDNACPLTYQQVPSSPTDANLLTLAADGDRDAFGTLYLRHRPALLSFVGKRWRSRGDYSVDDAVSEVFVRLWQNRQRLGSVCSFAAYLKAMARSIIADEARRPGIYIRGEFVLDGPAHEPSPYAIAEYNELVQRMGRALGDLTSCHRQAILFAQQGFTARQAASVVGCTDVAAQCRLQKARRWLLNLISRCGTNCAVDTHHSDRCPARVDGAECLKWLVRRRLGNMQKT